MTITLVTAQADLLSLLGNDSALYPAATTAEALRQALADLAQDGPHQSAVVTVPTTGATLHACLQALRAAGAREAAGLALLRSLA